MGASTDDLIWEALQDGRLTVDSETGAIYRRGVLTVGRANGRGYRQVSIRGRLAYEHRIVWMATHGARIPDGAVIDHRNGDTGDNRPENLEAVTQGENIRRSRQGRSIDYRLLDAVRDNLPPDVLAMAQSTPTRRDIADLLARHDVA